MRESLHYQFTMRAGVFHVQERSRKFSSTVMNSGAERTSSVTSRSSSRPSFDVQASCLIERISQCLRPLCIAGSSGDACSAERRAWRRLVGKNPADGSTGGFSPTGAVVVSGVVPLVRRTGWARHQQVFDSASNRDRCLPHLGETSPLLVCLCSLAHVVFLHKAFDGLVPHTLRNARSRLSIELQSMCGPAERSAQSAQLFFFFFFFFFLEALFAITVETPSPPNERSSFRKLLRTFATAP